MKPSRNSDYVVSAEPENSAEDTSLNYAESLLCASLTGPLLCFLLHIICYLGFSRETNDERFGILNFYPQPKKKRSMLGFKVAFSECAMPRKCCRME